MIKELPPKAFRLITIIINAMFRLHHFPDQWKNAQIILIPKPGKCPELVTSYRPISLLTVLSKIAEKVILKRINLIIQSKKLIPNHQFGFRSYHGTTEQVNRITAKIRNDLENKRYCSAVFLDVAQAFDKVWHKGLLYKLKKHLPETLYLLLESYLKNRTFQVKVNGETTNNININAGVPQGSVLGPTLYLLYTADLPTTENVTIATYADDTAILFSHSSPLTASEQTQKHLNEAQKWFRNWRIKINETKSSHITFTLRRDTCPPVQLNDKYIPQVDVVKYLGMHLDRRLTWKTHIWTKRKQLNLKFRKMYWLMGKKSKLSINNKLLVYKSILKPIWTYGIHLWGAASNSNIQIIERFQAKLLRNITNAPWYVTNEIIRNDLNIPTVVEEIKTSNTRYKGRLLNHPNKLASDLLFTSKKTRLKKYKIL